MRLRVDAHHHLWDPAAVSYAWLTDHVGPLARAFHPDELEPQLAAAGVEATILVQAANSRADTRYMFTVADARSWVAGVVAWVPLTGRAATARALDEIAHPQLVGVRHLLDGERSDWALDPAVIESLELLADHGLVLDYPALFPLHLDALPALAARVPDLTIVLDHLGSPAVGDGFDAWASQLAAAAEHENVFAKLSGFAPALEGDAWRASALQPYVDHAFAAFGAERLLWGSDWPVSLLAGPYERVHAEWQLALSRRSPRELDEVLGGTAERVYGI